MNLTKTVILSEGGLIAGVSGPRRCPPLRQLRNLLNQCLIAAFLVLPSASLPAQSAPQSPFAGLIAEYLRRDANGHSPNPDEISAMESLQPPPNTASIAEAMPYLLKALANPDIPLHIFALTALAGLQTLPPTPGTPAPQSAPAEASAQAETPPAPAPLPATYKPEIAKILIPYIPQIATHLITEDSQPNRLLTARILGGFTPNPPAEAYTPLLAYLKRDDAISPVGFAVITDLYQLGPLTSEAAAAVTRYLKRSDQTGDSRSDLADLIASRPNQSQAVNQSLVGYLASDDNALRARVILSLPQLDLSAQDFTDTKSRIEQIAANPNENLQVITAAKSVAPCWTATKMNSGCPVY